MELLLTPEDRGYPAEYLFSRIRGRRSRLVSNWRQLIFSASPIEAVASGKRGRTFSSESAWRDLVKEYRWVYGQMNEELREMFRPFFQYSELRTLFICLRQVVDKKAGSIADLLSISLLSDEIKDLLVRSVDLPSAVSGIEQLFVSYAPEFQGLEKTFQGGGIRGFEQRLTNILLAVTSAARLHPVMKTFFMRLIDSRNIMGLSKYSRMDFIAQPWFTHGGAVPEARFKEIMARDDPAALASLIREVWGIRIETNDPARLEVALYAWITRFLKKAGRDPIGVGLILDYLWRCSIEAMNLSVLYHTRDLERDAVITALVL